MSTLNRKLVAFLVCMVGFGILGFFKFQSRQLQARFLSTHSTNSNETECKNRTIDEFPADFLTLKQKRDGGVIIHVAITVYLFAALAIVCDDYFVESLNLISKDLKLKEDVAGATFMAAGSSAPELFTSIIGVLFAKSDVGTGTIVGSAIFNILCIIGICALAARSTLKIDWYPLSRDSFYYCISVVALILVLRDGYIYWYESVVMLVLYVIYVVMMYFNTRLERLIRNNFVNKIKSNISIKYSEDDDEVKVFEGSQEISPLLGGNDDDDDDDKPLNPLDVPEKLHAKIIWGFLLPIKILFFFTVPDCKRRFFQRFPLYFLTFIMSTVYLAVLTYLLVWMVVIIAYTIDIPDTVAGLTLLAAGTSVPEIVSGIIVTRKGKGDMAISNSIGSNIFDILICLGFPWFISTVILGSSSVKIYSEGIVYSAAILLGTVVIMIACFLVNKWKLNKKFGLILLFLWVTATTITCLFEMNVFGKFSLPSC